ncbi:MAG: hypothetical protein U1F36_15205 [Planctomycetota bacterium]
MTDQVQHLIDRIRKDAVQASRQQADETLAQARVEAERILSEARTKAGETIAAAEREAKDFAERGKRTLQHAARDLLIAIGQGIERIVEEMVDAKAAAALSPQIVEQMLLRLADSFARNGISEGQIAIAVDPADREQLTRFVMAELLHKLEQGVDVQVDPRMGRGFRISYSKGKVRHDFTVQATAEALMQLVRPQIAEVVMKSALAVGATAVQS